MRVVWLTGLAACLAVQGCTPPPSGYYGAPPGYAPQPYASTPGGAGQPYLPPPDGSVQQDPDPGYAQPGYPSPVVVAPGPGLYGYGSPAPAYGYASPPPFLPLGGFYGGRDRFDRGRFERERFERGRFERDRFQADRGREQFERERFERSRFRERMERDRPRPPPQQPQPAQALQGLARPQDLRRPPDRQERRGFTPEQLRGLR